MISIQNTSGKTCVYCGEDCADRPRIRDPKGRYSCQACLERVNRNREVRERAVAPCPGCGGLRLRDVIVCFRCGFDRRLGRRLETVVD
ncbi:MAG: hypothetical protein ACYTG1_13545 [Planctomycetota bacterium]|jgi:hypothetical protein